MGWATCVDTGFAAGLQILLARRSPVGAVVPVSVRAPVAMDGAGGWSLPRAAVAGALWGQGLVAPFDRDDAQALTDRLGLAACDHVLLVGGGPGGVERLLREACGADVTAYECEPLLGLLGGARAFDGRRPDFGRQGYDFAVVMDVPPQCRDEDMIAAAALALRPGGRMAIEASVADVESVARALRNLRCAIELAEDSSDAMMRRVLSGWARLAGQLGRGGARSLPPDGKRALMLEMERWMPRIANLRAGRVRHVRVCARGRGIGLAAPLQREAA